MYEVPETETYSVLESKFTSPTRIFLCPFYLKVVGKILENIHQSFGTLIQNFHTNSS